MNSYDTRRPSKKEKIIKEMQEGKKKSPPYINIKLTPDLKKQFYSIVVSQGYNMTDTVAYLIEKYVEEWKKKYLVISPIEGTIHFSGIVQEHQQLHVNQLICFVSSKTSRYYAEMYIPQFNLGKVRMGQQVLLKFPSYPYQEYGSMRGNIEFISTMPTDTGYRAKVSLPTDLTTDYQKQIQYRDGLWAHGEIITEKIRLLERFYYNIIKEIRK